jgi:hypothetical protein
MMAQQGSVTLLRGVIGPVIDKLYKCVEQATRTIKHQ